MRALIQRFRGAGVALVVLALSAGVVMAGAPGLAPVSSPGVLLEAPEGSTEPTVTPDASDEAEDEDADDEEGAKLPDDDSASQAGAPASSHGTVVSGAARASTPPGFANHGAYVSCVAKLSKDPAASLDWAVLTPEDCAPAASTDPEAADDAGKAKGEGAKTKAPKDKAEGRGGGNGKSKRGG
jgi:hypothetical protein